MADIFPFVEAPYFVEGIVMKKFKIIKKNLKFKTKT
jgi:hypothetical protein